jgi:hypothetical protein
VEPEEVAALVVESEEESLRLRHPLCVVAGDTVTADNVRSIPPVPSPGRTFRFGAAEGAPFILDLI